MMPVSATREKLSDALRRETRPHHERIERNSAMARVLDHDVTIQEYRALLERLYGFHHPLEERLAAVVGEAIDYDRRRKSPRLRRDLVALGLTNEQVDTLPLCSELPEVTSHARALGCMYVVEGATLGGKIISRHLKDVLELSAGNGAAYFNGYGRHTGPMWRRFKLIIDSHEADSVERAATIDAACETFMTMDRWLARP